MGQFHIKNRRLHLIKTRIYSLIDMMIFIIASIIGKRAYFIRKCLIIRCDTTSIPHCAKILSWIKAKGTCVA